MSKKTLFILKWSIITLIAFIVGFYLEDKAGQLLSNAITKRMIPTTNQHRFLMLADSLFLFTPLIIAQYFLIKSKVKSKLWIPLSLLGIIIAWLAIMQIQSVWHQLFSNSESYILSFNIIKSLTTGLILGLFQWIILKKHNKAWLWILTTVLLTTSLEYAQWGFLANTIGGDDLKNLFDTIAANGRYFFAIIPFIIAGVTMYSIIQTDSKLIPDGAKPGTLKSSHTSHERFLKQGKKSK